MEEVAIARGAQIRGLKFRACGVKVKTRGSSSIIGPSLQVLLYTPSDPYYLLQILMHLDII
jgi:hypothetical protein